MKTARRHWFYLVKHGVIALGVFLFIFSLAKNGESKGAWLFLLLPIAFAAWKFLVWKNDNLYITSHRVILESGVLSFGASENTLEKIQNIDVGQKLFGRIFNYGDIMIQTAATAGATVYWMIQDPQAVREVISTAQDAVQRGKMAGAAEQLAASLRGNASAGDTKSCPFCEEDIKKAAKFCRYCNHELS